MPSSPSTSVIFPVYQGITFLREAVESVLSQEAIPFELVIGDDGSTDGSRAYLESLRDPRVRFFPAKGRQGLFRHLNQLISRSRGQLVRFFCQDDVMEPGCLKTEWNFFESHPDVAISMTKYRTVDAQGTIGPVGELEDLPEVLSRSLAVQQLFYHGCIAGNLSTVCLRSSVLHSVGGFNEEFRVSGDYDLWARFAQVSPIGIVRRPLVRVRTHAKQLSRARQSAVPFVLENSLVRKNLLTHLPKQVQSAACKFERRRHHVLDWHLALRCLIAGRWQDAFTILQSMGLLGSSRAFLAWVWTMNNRRRPQAPWILSDGL